jgi:hypothetical protein
MVCYELLDENLSGVLGKIDTYVVSLWFVLSAAQNRCLSTVIFK